VPNFVEKAKPLTDLMSKGVSKRLPWTSDYHRALEELKQARIDAVQKPLYIIEWDKPFAIFVDASGFAVAGVLTQPDGEGGQRPIAFHSAKLTKAQQNWATVEHEAYAAISSLKKFRAWIFGGPEVILYSDHNPLTYLTMAAPMSAKLMRWSLALQDFNNLVFKYKVGKTNLAADCLSRTGM